MSLEAFELLRDDGVMTRKYLYIVMLISAISPSVSFAKGEYEEIVEFLRQSNASPSDVLEETLRYCANAEKSNRSRLRDATSTSILDPVSEPILRLQAATYQLSRRIYDELNRQYPMGDTSFPRFLRTRSPDAVADRFRTIVEEGAASAPSYGDRGFENISCSAMSERGGAPSETRVVVQCRGRHEGRPIGIRFNSSGGINQVWSVGITENLPIAEDSDVVLKAESWIGGEHTPGERIVGADGGVRFRLIDRATGRQSDQMDDSDSARLADQYATWRAPLECQNAHLDLLARQVTGSSQADQAPLTAADDGSEASAAQIAQ